MMIVRRRDAAATLPMLAPRFSIRTLLAVLTVGAIVFLLAGVAVRGELWAWGVTIGALSVVVAALVHAAWFGLVWLFAQLPASRKETGPSSSRQSVPPSAN
ncbi:MAG: hypothetical protein WD669_11770 [Pirellulales bacterium]